MASYVWDQQLATGIGIIDEQHKKLVGMVNELHEAMRTKTAVERIAQILEEMTEYTKYHFSLENRAFEEYHYAKRSEHERSHRQFIKKIEELKSMRRNGNLTVNMQTYEFLADWVRQHIVNEDKQYVDLLKGKDLSKLMPTATCACCCTSSR